MQYYNRKNKQTENRTHFPLVKWTYIAFLQTVIPRDIYMQYKRIRVYFVGIGRKI